MEDFVDKDDLQCHWQIGLDVDQAWMPDNSKAKYIKTLLLYESVHKIDKTENTHIVFSGVCFFYVKILSPVPVQYAEKSIKVNICRFILKPFKKG